MKLSSILLILLCISCGKPNSQNKLYNVGNSWVYELNSDSKTGDSVKLKIKSKDGEVVYEWNYKESFHPNGKVNKENTTGRTLPIFGNKLQIVSLSSDDFWEFLPDIIADNSMKINEVVEDEVNYKKGDIKIKNYDENGKLIDTKYKKSEGGTINYPFILKRLNNIYYSNEKVKDSCQHYIINFKYKVQGSNFYNTDIAYDYYFNEKYGFVYIKINVGNSKYYELEVKDFKIKDN